MSATWLPDKACVSSGSLVGKITPLSSNGTAREILQIWQHSRDKLSPFRVNFCFPAGLRCGPAGFGNAAVWLIDECFVADSICALLVPSLASSAPFAFPLAANIVRPKWIYSQDNNLTVISMGENNVWASDKTKCSFSAIHKCLGGLWKMCCREPSARKGRWDCQEMMHKWRWEGKIYSIIQTICWVGLLITALAGDWTTTSPPLFDVSRNELTQWVFHFTIWCFFLLGCDLRGKYNLFTLPFCCISEAGFLWLCRVLHFFAMTEILSYEQMVAKPLRSSFSSFCSLQAARKGGNIHHIAWETVKRNTILVCFEFGLLD